MPLWHSLCFPSGLEFCDEESLFVSKVDDEGLGMEHGVKQGMALPVRSIVVGVGDGTWYRPQPVSVEIVAFQP